MKGRKAARTSTSTPPRAPADKSAAAAKVWSPARLLVTLALIGAILGTYAQTFRYGFVDFDDDVYVTENPAVQRGVTLESLRWALSTTHAANWHPLTWLSHLLDWQWYGASAGGHHATSVVLHTANTLLLLWVLSAMTGHFWPSLLTAALFALHPAHVESVAWIAERKDVLSTFFAFATIGLYYRYRLAPAPGRYALVLVSFALGLMAKPMLVTLPLLLVLLDIWPLGRLSRTTPGEGHGSTLRDLLWQKAPLLAMAAASSAVTFAAQRSGGAVQTLESIPAGARLANAVVSYGRYLAMLVWPADLAVFYPYPETIAWGACAASLFFVVGFTLLAWKTFASRPYLLIGWLWFVVAMVPVIGIVQVGDQALADRYTYLPYVGLFVLVSWSVREVCLRRPGLRATCAALCVLCVAAFAGLSWRQTGYWRDSPSLFEHAIAAVPGNYLGHHNLGYYFSRRGRLDDAMAHYQEALRIRPDYTKALANLGATFAVKGDGEAATTYYERALRLRPRFAEARANLGMELSRQGRYAEAEEHLLEALRIRPDYFKARYALGLLYLKWRKPAQAAEELSQAVQLAPEDADVRVNLGAALSAVGRSQEAATQYEQSLRLKPDSPTAHNNLGTVLASQGRMDEALRHFAEAVRLAPQSADAHFNLARAAWAAGHREEARAGYERLKVLEPALAESLRQFFDQKPASDRR